MNANTEQLDSLLETARKATREKELAKVIDTCEKALDIAPGDSRFEFMQGAALRRAGDYNKADALLRRTVESVPALATAHLELGLNFLSLGSLSAARRSLEQAVSIDATLRPAWIALCEIRSAEGDHPGAAEAYRRSLRTIEMDPVLQKAFELHAKGRVGVAEGICREYLRQRPMDVDAIRLLAQIGIDLGVVDEAIKLLERCLELAPDFHFARSNYVTALGRQQRFDKALEEMARLEKADPGNFAYMSQSAALLSMAGKFDDAHEKFRAVIKRAPDNPRLLTNFGHSLRYGGKGDEAIDTYLQAIEADPGAGEAWWSLANLKTFKFEDEQVADMRDRLATLEGTSPDKYHLAFALGKALEDAKNYDESFSAYMTGNEIKRQFSAYDRDDTSARVDAAIEQTSADWFDGTGHDSDEPIFIVGLPRAGSTLLEQILASHSQVEATAELPFIGQAATDISGRRKRTDDIIYPGIIQDLAEEQREAFGQQYLARAMTYRKGKPHFIDKLPNNFMHIALIKRILPNATIIDARREPMAACFANLKQLFAEGQEFTYSQEDIANYYADYIRLMDHWHEILPGQILTVQYEDVVDDLETQVRRLLDHCGLEFEESCVRYYEKDRAVRTASSEQVRQPIYRDAMKQWQNYEAHLGPIRDILEARGII
ncbi:MAG: sulfotransferase [Gammaproteobacteria bacterium]|nr:sulfotransferase [Gammaproteobacteria bacterium]